MIRSYKYARSLPTSRQTSNLVSVCGRSCSVEINLKNQFATFRKKKLQVQNLGRVCSVILNNSNHRRCLSTQIYRPHWRTAGLYKNQPRTANGCFGLGPRSLHRSLCHFCAINLILSSHFIGIVLEKA